MKSQKKLKLGVVGMGHMGQAIVEGILRTRTLKPEQIGFLSRHPARDRLIKNKYGIRLFRHASEICENTPVLLIAVKPKDVATVLNLLKPDLKKYLILSVAAGIGLKHYQKFLFPAAKVIRAMPNMPVRIGKGVVVYTVNKNCTSRDRKLFRKLFSPLGLVVESRHEKYLDSVTALSGSGPAFVFYFAEALREAGKEMGLPLNLSSQLAVQTLKGAACLLEYSGQSPQHLIADVATKGGITEAGLNVLRKKGFTKMVKACMLAAERRCRWLNKKYGGLKK